MPAPTITPLPDPPLRSQAPATFGAKAEAWVEVMGGFTDDVNAFGAYLDSLGLDPLDQTYIWGFAMVGAASDGEVLNIHAVGRAFTLTADFGGGALQVTKGANPTAASIDVTLQRSTDGGATWVDVATISIASDGTVTATTAANADVLFAKGNGLRAVGPATADATFADWAFTIIGVS